MTTAATLLVIDAEKIDALTAALTRVADNQDRLLAGQAAAIDKIEGGKATATRTRKAKEEPAAGNATPSEEKSPADTGSAADDAASAYKLPEIADLDAFKTYVGAWTGAVEGDARAKRVDFLKAVAANFGGTGFSGAFEGGKKAIFFIERAKALGIEAVNLKADYDLDGAPDQGAAAPAASDDDFG